MAYSTLGEVAQSASPTVRTGKGHSRKDLTGFSVKFAENGYSVDCSYEWMDDEDHKQYESVQKVFESARSLIEFLEDQLEKEKE